MTSHVQYAYIINSLLYVLSALQEVYLANPCSGLGKRVT